MTGYAEWMSNMTERNRQQDAEMRARRAEMFAQEMRERQERRDAVFKRVDQPTVRPTPPLPAEKVTPVDLDDGTW